jgi:hypothetical protein
MAAACQGALELVDAAESGAEDNRHPLGRGGDGGVRQEVLSRGQQKLGGSTSGVMRMEHRPELLDLAAAPHAQVVDREALDHRDAVASSDEPGPERIEVDTERSHRPGRHERDGLSAQGRGSLRSL